MSIGERGRQSRHERLPASRRDDVAQEGETPPPPGLDAEDDLTTPVHVEPSRAEWRRLYDAAARVFALAPWQWMDEMEFFAVRDSESDHVGYASVMGSLGEHLAVAVYQGRSGLAALLDLQRRGEELTVEAILQIPHLQASFEDREKLERADHEVIRSLGLRFRGQQTWPMFRSWRPGWLPWFLDAAEARFLALVLEQALDVLPRSRDGDVRLGPDRAGRYLTRVPRREGGELLWSDERLEVLPAQPEPIPIKAAPADLALLADCPATAHVVQVTFAPAPFEIAEAGQRPYIPYLLVVVEAASGYILGMEPVAPEATPGRTLGMAPFHLGGVLARHRLRPSRIEVRAEALAAVIRHIADPLGIRVAVVRRLPALDEAMETLAGMMGGAGLM